MISIYRDVFDKTSKVYREPLKVLELIRIGKYKEKIHQLRQCDDKDTKNRIKTSLISICFSGTFESRYDKKIIKHSGLVVLDFDKLQDVEVLKDKFKKNKYCYSVFISPSGNGLKVLFKIPAEIENHESYYLGIMDYCKKQKYPELDTTSKNISRVCFISYDPDIYINENSDIFDTKGTLKKHELKVEKISEAQTTDFQKMQICCDMIRNSGDGNKHENLIKASRLAGGFIGGGYVEEYEAVRLLESEINKKNPDNFKLACKTIQDGIEHGKKSPIEKKDYKKAYEKIMVEQIIIEDAPAKDVILCKDLEKKILYSYQHGASQGETTYFKDFDEVYRMKRGEVTLWHGIPNHGKSAFVYQLALIKSIKDGTRWGIFSPENLPHEEFYRDLIHSYIGKWADKTGSNHMTEEELIKGIDFVHKHFFLIYPEDDAPTLEYMNTRFRELIIKHNIDGCIIDPYNQMDNDITAKGGREDQYLSWFLTKSKRFAVEQNVFYYIIAHPKSGLQKMKNTQNYEMPNVYNLSGGAMWANKCDNIICVHRPNYSDKFDTSVLVCSQKIKKQKTCGVPGVVNFKYDRLSARYYENEISTPLPNFDDKSKEQVKNTVSPPKDILHNYKEEPKSILIDTYNDDFLTQDNEPAPF